MSRKREVVGFAVLTLLGFAASPAYADFSRWVPGSTCMPALGDETQSAYTVNWSEIRNDSTTDDLTVVCPFYKEEAGYAGLSFLSDVYVYDGNCSENITCSMRAIYSVPAPYTNDYDSIGSGDWSSVTGGSDDYGRLVGQMEVQYNGSGIFGYGWVYMACTLPPRDTTGGCSGYGRSYITSIRQVDTSTAGPTEDMDLPGIVSVGQWGHEDWLHGSDTLGVVWNTSTSSTLDVGVPLRSRTDDGYSSWWEDYYVNDRSCTSYVSCTTKAVEWGSPTSLTSDTDYTSSGTGNSILATYVSPSGGPFVYSGECSLPKQSSGCSGSGYSQLSGVRSTPNPVSGAEFDDLIVSGLACVPTYGNESRISYEVGTGTARNSSTSELEVTCPVDHPYDIGDSSTIDVLAYDGHCTESVQCTAYSVDAVVPTSLASDTDLTPKYSKYLGVLGLDVSTSDWSSVMHVKCSLPAYSSSTSCGTGSGYSRIEAVRQEVY